VISSHIPITPRGVENNNFSVGYAGIPEYSSFTGECTGTDYHHVSDTLKATDRDIRVYSEIMDSLGITVESSLSNESLADNNLVPQLRELWNKGFLQESEESIISCEANGGCGMTQFLSVEGQELHAHGNHAILREGKCSICGHEVGEMRKQSLLLEIPCFQKEDIFSGAVYPDYGDKDIRHILDRLSGTRLLLSRTKETKYSINLGNRRYFLDNDLANYSVLTSLNKHSELKYFFTGRNIVRQVALMGILHRMVSDNPFDGNIIFSPRITLKSNKNGEKITTKSPLYFIEKGYYPQSIVFALLTAYLNPNKDVTIDSGLIYHAQYALNTQARRTNMRESDRILGLPELMDIDFQEMISKLIKKMKNIENKDLSLSCAENHVLKFVSQIKK
jgi:hypothetical protein